MTLSGERFMRYYTQSIEIVTFHCSSNLKSHSVRWVRFQFICILWNESRSYQTPLPLQSNMAHI